MKSDIMTRLGSIAAIVAITLVNLAFVGASSILAVGGDGSAEGVYWVFGIGCAWMTIFAIRAFALAAKGEHRAAISFAAKAIPYALLAVILTEIIIAFVDSAHR